MNIKYATVPVNFREPNEFGEGATMMTRNVNEPLPDHYGTDDWENTDTLTSHLHGDGEGIATFARDLAAAQTATDPEFATALSKNRSDLYMKPSQNED